MSTSNEGTIGSSTTDRSVDVVIIGSGGGGLVAGLAAHDAGVDALILEKQRLVGGSTAMSGGVIWLPDNPVMRAAGVADSYEDGLAYFDDVVGDVGPASSFERRHAFLTEGPRMIRFLQQRGVRLEHCAGYSDYYSNHKGGNAAGRSIEPKPFDARQLGEWQGRIQPGLAAGIGFVVKTNEMRDLQHYNRSPRTFLATARIVGRTGLARLAGRVLLTNGASLIAQLLKAVLEDGTPVWAETSFQQLLVEDGRVVGVEVSQGGVPLRIMARKGVVLSAGGFARNAEMRRSYSGDQPNAGKWTIANPGDTGEALEQAMSLGAKTDLMDEAWWLPGPGGILAGSTLGMARQRPGSIFVDAAGQRFVNESNSYVEVGKAMYARNQQSRAVPCWLVVDDAYRRRYAHTKGLPGRFPQDWIDRGALKKAGSLEELAEACAIDPTGLVGTVEKFNANARSGLDPDFGRGQSAYNRCLGDPGYKPNPALGPLAEPPFYAAEIYPSDVGTCGGLLTNEQAQVLDHDDQPIPGLYATGNNTATVMGRTYLGAGASIANTMVFGYVAGRHAATAAAAGAGGRDAKRAP